MPFNENFFRGDVFFRILNIDEKPTQFMIKNLSEEL